LSTNRPPQSMKSPAHSPNELWNAFGACGGLLGAKCHSRLPTSSNSLWPDGRRREAAPEVLRGIAPRPRRGAAKTKSTDPPVHLLNPRPTHPPSDLVRFWAFLGKGSSKTPQTYLYKKSMSKTFPKKSTNISMSVFSRLFFIAFSGVSQRWEFKSTTKNVLQKKSCRKVCTKIDQESKTDVFSNFILSRFWAFLGEGSSKTR
jgi:hypothetical protein